MRRASHRANSWKRSNGQRFFGLPANGWIAAEPPRMASHAMRGMPSLEQNETGGRDGPGMLRESGRQRHVPLRCPNFQIPGVQALHGRNGDDEIADGARADDEPLQELSIALIVRP